MKGTSVAKKAVATASTFVEDVMHQNSKAVHARIVKKEKCNVTCKDPDDPARSCSPLHKAVEIGSVDIVTMLVKAGADVNAKDSFGATTLQCAVRRACPSSAQLIRELVAHKADVKAADADGKTVIDFACTTCTDQAVLETLLDAARPLQHPDGSQPYLVTAAKAGNTTGIPLLIKYGANPGEQDASGYTALMHALSHGHSAAVDALLATEDRCNLGAQDRQDGWSALHMACTAQKPDLELVAKLLRVGAAPDLQSSRTKETPLMLAVSGRQTELALLLLKYCKQVNLQDSKKATALDRAVVAKDLQLVQALIATGGDVGIHGVPLLKEAMMNKQDAFVAQLVRVVKDSALQALDLDFRQLTAAGLPGAAVAYLQRNSKQPLQQPVNDHGDSHLHVAVETSNDGALAEAFVLSGIAPDCVNKDNDTPLHVAARCGGVEVCKALLRLGADPTRRNSKNRTPGGQLKLSAEVKELLGAAEEAFKVQKAQKQSQLWDDKMKATQTESALGLLVI